MSARDWLGIRTDPLDRGRDVEAGEARTRALEADNLIDPVLDAQAAERVLAPHMGPWPDWGKPDNPHALLAWQKAVSRDWTVDLVQDGDGATLAGEDIIPATMTQYRQERIHALDAYTADRPHQIDIHVPSAPLPPSFSAGSAKLHRETALRNLDAYAYQLVELGQLPHKSSEGDYAPYVLVMIYDHMNAELRARGEPPVPAALVEAARANLRRAKEADQRRAEALGRGLMLPGQFPGRSDGGNDPAMMPGARSDWLGAMQRAAAVNAELLIVDESHGADEIARSVRQAEERPVIFAAGGDVAREMRAIIDRSGTPQEAIQAFGQRIATEILATAANAFRGPVSPPRPVPGFEAFERQQREEEERVLRVRARAGLPPMRVPPELTGWPVMVPDYDDSERRSVDLNVTNAPPEPTRIVEYPAADEVERWREQWQEEAAEPVVYPAGRRAGRTRASGLDEATRRQMGDWIERQFLDAMSDDEEESDRAPALDLIPERYRTGPLRYTDGV